MGITRQAAAGAGVVGARAQTWRAAGALACWRIALEFLSTSASSFCSVLLFDFPFSHSLFHSFSLRSLSSSHPPFYTDD